MQERLPTLDVVQMIKYDPTRSGRFTANFSKRARYDMAVEASELGKHWHNHVDGARERYHKEQATRSGTFTKNKAGTNRAQSQKAGGLLAGGAFQKT